MPLFLSLCLAIVTSLGTSANAGEIDDYRMAVASALESMDAQPMDEHWFFTITVEQEDDIRIMHSSPVRQQAARRELVSVNGQPPSQEQLAQHQTQENKRIEDEAAQGDSKGYLYLVDSRTLSLPERTNDGPIAPYKQKSNTVELHFAPRIKAFEEDQASLAGTLVLNLEQNTVDKISIHNTAKLSPAFSVSLMRYQMELVFALHQTQQLLHQMNTHLQGKYGFMKKFDSTVDITFSDFRRYSP